MTKRSVTLLLLSAMVAVTAEAQPAIKPPPKPLFPLPGQSSSDESDDEAAPSFSAIVDTLRQGAEQKRLEAIEKLQQVKASAEEKLATLREGLDSESEAIRLQVLGAIEQIQQKDPETVAKLIKIAESAKSDLEQVLASRATLQMTDDKATRTQMIDRLADGLQSKDPSVANQSIAALQQAGEESIPTLLESLKSENPVTRGLAAEALGNIEAEPAAKQLAQLLNDSSSMVRAAAITAVGKLQPSNEVTARLQAILKDDSQAPLQARAAGALGQLAGDDANVMASLAQAAQASSSAVGATCVRSIGQSELPNPAKAQLLGQILPGASPSVSAAVTEHLVELGAPGLQVLTDALNDERSRYWAVIGISDLGSDATAATDTLAKVLESSTPDVQIEILLAMAAIDAPKDKVSQAVNVQLTSESAGIRYAATLTAIRTGMSGDQTQDALKTNTESKDAMLRLVSQFALAKLNPRSPIYGLQAVKALGQAIASKDPRLKQLAGLALKELKD